MKRPLRSRRMARGLGPIMVALAFLIALPMSSLPALASSARSDGTVLWGAYVHGGVDDPRRIDAFEAQAGKRAALLMFGQPWMVKGAYQPFPTVAMQHIRDRGSIPVLDWGSWELGRGLEQPPFRLRAIADGAHDAYLTTWARSARAWGHPFFLRLNAEMNGWWHPWDELTNGNRPGEFVQAWRRVVDIFEREGATNVTWVWCPNVHVQGATPMPSLYPGDEYVDWVCLDGYNWAEDRGEPWFTFAQVFGGSEYTDNVDSYALLQEIAPGKPIMLGETASSEDGGSKAAWITDMLGSQLPTHFPKVRAFLWFNWNDDDPVLDWPIDSSQSATKAFAAGIAHPLYATNTFGTLRQSPIQPLGQAASYREAVLEDVPAAYWRLGEHAGETAADQLGGLTGSYDVVGELGAAGVAPDGDAALRIATQSGGVTVPDHALLSPQAPPRGRISVETWVYVRALPSTEPADLVFKGAETGYEYALRLLPSGAAEFVLWAPGGSTYQSAASGAHQLQPDAWYHIVGTCEVRLSCRLSVNGQEVVRVSEGWGAAGPADGGAPLTIGGRTGGADVTIDEVAIYGHALSPARVQAHYQLGQGDTPPGTRALP